MKTKPFNLQEAIHGKVVVDTKGRQGKYIYSMQNPNNFFKGYIHIFIFSGESGKEFMVNANDDGDSVLTVEFLDNEKLAIKCAEREYWIATGNSSITKGIYSTRPFYSEGEAVSNLIDSITPVDGSIQTHKITRYE